MLVTALAGRSIKHCLTDPLTRSAAVTMVATLGAFLSTWAVGNAAGLRSDVIVLGTALALMGSRATGRERESRGAVVLRVTAVPLAALAAAEVGRLIVDHRVLGGAVFATVMAAAIWLRRFGRRWARVGTLVSLPFVALLVAPVQPGSGFERSLWPAGVALLALGWVALAQGVARRVGFVAPPEHVDAEEPVRRAGLAASTRMAVQMGLALGTAYALGRWWFPEHWMWAVLSAYVTGAGNRGRGDVVHKGINRLAGALAGTATATVVASLVPAGDRLDLVLLFLVMGVAVWARGHGYAYWAAGTTAMMALLQGYYGVAGIHLLVERLAGVALGSLVAILVAWLVLPLRSGDAFRVRWAAALAATGDLLAALHTTPEDVPGARHRLARAIGQLELLEPALLLHRRAFHRSTPIAEAHPADLLARLRELHQRLDDVVELPPETLAGSAPLLTGWRHQVTVIRQRMRTDHAAANDDTAALPHVDVGVLDRATDAIVALDGAFTRSAWLRLGSR